MYVSARKRFWHAPATVFLKLQDIGGDVLSPYDEQFVEVPMSSNQASAYDRLSRELTQALKAALARKDTTLLGVVLNVLLAWPDCCFRPESVKHPRSRDLINFTKSIFDDESTMPKEDELVEMCRSEMAEGRKVLVYSTYTGKRDTTSRLKRVLEQAGSIPPTVLLQPFPRSADPLYPCFASAHSPISSMWIISDYATPNGKLGIPLGMET